MLIVRKLIGPSHLNAIDVKRNIHLGLDLVVDNYTCPAHTRSLTVDFSLDAVHTCRLRRCCCRPFRQKTLVAGGCSSIMNLTKYCFLLCFHMMFQEILVETYLYDYGSSTH